MSDRIDFSFFMNIFWVIINLPMTVIDLYWISKDNSNVLIWIGLFLCGSVALMNFIVIVYKTYLIRKRIANEAKN
jgi:hypothetical protein